ncbi:HNH endonuclease [Litorimonas sp. WD9-15]|uniref:HNH endonuclease n=1 Tax=Litorimonas sp. WD9-15 TaxID=3418716 RepID=UPI003D06F356
MVKLQLVIEVTYQEKILYYLSEESIELEMAEFLKLGKTKYSERASDFLDLGKVSSSRSYFLETKHGLMPMKLIARTAYAKNYKGWHDYNSIAYARALEKLGFKVRHERSKSKQEPKIKPRARKRKYYDVLVRPNQADFRRRVIKKFKGRCFLTGCRVEEAMEAAHILPVAEDGSDETRNGILIRRDIHRLFDLDLITISPKNGNVKIAKEIRAEYRDQIEASVDLKMLDIEMLKLRYG